MYDSDLSCLTELLRPQDKRGGGGGGGVCWGGGWCWGQLLSGGPYDLEIGSTNA